MAEGAVATKAANPLLGVCDVLRSPTQMTRGDEHRRSLASDPTLASSTLVLSLKHNTPTGRVGYPKDHKQKGLSQKSIPVGEGRDQSACCFYPAHYLTRLGKWLGWIPRPVTHKHALQDNQEGRQDFHKGQDPPMLQDRITTLPMPCHWTPQRTQIPGWEMPSIFCLSSPSGYRPARKTALRLTARGFTNLQ